MSEPIHSEATEAVDRPTIRDHLRTLGIDPVEVVKPWLTLREQWQAIYDRSLPSSAVGQRAKEMLDYIDLQLARASGR